MALQQIYDLVLAPQYLGWLWQGFLLTLWLSACAVLSGTLLGFLLAGARDSRWRPLSLLAVAYSSLFRNTPLLIQLFFWYFAVGQVLPRALIDQNIAVVRRADGSGTSYVFTSYLAKVNAEWKEKIGSGNTVNWPTGLGGKGNDGVAAFVQRLPGSIGYVEYAYAKQNNLAYTKLKSADGKVVSPTETTFSNSTKNIDWSKSFAQDLTNQAGDAWPITSTTFILVHTAQKNAEQGTQVLKFFDWAYKTGGKEANALDYATLPNSVVEQVRAAWKTHVKDASGKALY